MDRRQIPRASSRIRLGNTELVSPIARGGSGEVWHARHLGEGLSVAVKVMHGDARRDDLAQRMFRQEVRAVARLEHPGIIKVFDHGEVPREAARRSEGRLAAGAPYLIMEYCPHGSLERYAPEGWNGVRKILLSLLQPLAHAHARGVVHRDVKPANVLLGSTAEGQAHFDRLLITDFGIAHALGPGSSTASGSVTGTPHYMAPEQVLGRTRDLGPWSDLYSIGCVAWELVTGHAPYAHLEGSAVLQAHVGTEPPDLDPGVPVPAEFETWLARMLEKDHRYRYQRAADAAWALMTMSEPQAVMSERRFAPTPVATARFTLWGRTLDTFSQPDEEVSFQGGTLHDWGFDDDDDDDDAPTSIAPEEPDRPNPVPPFPESWRRTHEAPTPMRLIRAGLGLFGMRTPPMAGRSGERDALWDTLGWVRRYRHPRAVMLRGRAGLGKSRLAQWTAERAEELGAAVVLRARHDPGGGPEAGLVPMVQRLFATGGLERAGLTAQVRRVLQPLGLDTNDEVLDALAFLNPEAEQAHRFDGPSERYAVLVRVLRALADDRPVVVWLDDLQWGADALAFIGHLLAEHDLPLLVIGTVQTDALESSSLEEQWLSWLADHPDVTELEIGPLTRRSQTDLVNSLLGLHHDLVERIVDRTGGNPLFAVQIIGDWVQRGLLKQGEQGFELADDAHLDVPDDVHELWMQRVHSALGETMPEVLPALEIAACLGAHVFHDEWTCACDHASVSTAAEHLDSLAASKLITTAPDGFEFAHNLLRESLERSARERLRVAGHHRACAAMIRERYGESAPPARLAHHLLAGKRPEEALAPLLASAQHQLDAGEGKTAADTVATWQHAIALAKIPEHDPRHLAGLTVRARSLLNSDDYDTAAEVAQAIRQQARRSKQEAHEAEALLVLGELATRRGQRSQGTGHLRAARRLFQRQAVPMREAAALRALADLGRSTGAIEQAMTLAQEALALSERFRHERAIADAHLLIGSIAQQQEDHGRAEPAFRQALGIYQRRGLRRGVLNATVGLAEVARVRGLLDDADAQYQRAIAEAQRIGSVQAAVLPLNRALIAVERRTWSDALQYADAVRPRLEQLKREPLIAFADVVSLVALAAVADWFAFDRYLRRATDLLKRTGFADADLARCADLAGELAAGKHDRARAQQAWELSAIQWDRLGHADRAIDVLAKIDTFTTGPRD